MSRVPSHLVCCLFNNCIIFYLARKKAVLFLLLLIGISAPFISFSSAHEAEKIRGRSSNAQPSQTPPQGCCGQNADKDNPHLLAASYYNVGNNLTATLMLNNKGPEPVEVKPTLFSLTGERLEAAPVIVEGESFRNINLRDLGALPARSFRRAVSSCSIAVPISSSVRNCISLTNNTASASMRS